MVKGAIKSSEWMYLGAEKLKNRINPEAEPRTINPKLKTTLGAARWMTCKTVQASGYLVSKAGTATVALGRFLAPHIKHHSAKALSHVIEQSDEKSHKQLDIAGESQCRNFRIFLSLRFYVKSILGILEVQKLLFLSF